MTNEQKLSAGQPHSMRTHNAQAATGVMPTFLIIGAARSGTTALYTYLSQHPMVFMSPRKEPNFFAFEGERLNYRGPGHDYTINRSITDLHAYQDLFRGASGETARGEASTIYLYSAEAPRCIHRHISDAKLIAILRNPVEQCYSSFLYAKRECLEPSEDFMGALAAEEARIRKHWQPMYYFSRIPMYYEQLSRYYTVFAADQLKVFLYEDFANAPYDVLAAIFRLIGVDDSFVPDLTYRPNAGGIPKIGVLQKILMKPYPLIRMAGRFIPHAQRRRLKDALSTRNLTRPPLPPEARARLLLVFREDIIKLQDLLGRDLSGWLK